MSDEKPTLTKQAMAAYEAAIKHSHGECTFVTEALALIPALVREVGRLKSEKVKWQRRAGLFREAYRDADFERFALSLQKMQLEGLGTDATLLKQRDGMKRKLNLVVNERNELRAALTQKEAAAFPCYAIQFKDDEPVAFGATILAVWMQAEKLLGEDVEKLIEQGYRLVEGRWRENDDER